MGPTGHHSAALVLVLTLCAGSLGAAAATTSSVKGAAALSGPGLALGNTHAGVAAYADFGVKRASDPERLVEWALAVATGGPHTIAFEYLAADVLPDTVGGRLQLVVNGNDVEFEAPGVETDAAVFGDDDPTNAVALAMKKSLNFPSTTCSLPTTAGCWATRTAPFAFPLVKGTNTVGLRASGDFNAPLIASVTLTPVAETELVEPPFGPPDACGELSDPVQQDECRTDPDCSLRVNPRDGAVLTCDHIVTTTEMIILGTGVIGYVGVILFYQCRQRKRRGLNRLFCCPSCAEVCTVVGGLALIIGGMVAWRVWQEYELDNTFLAIGGAGGAVLLMCIWCACRRRRRKNDKESTDASTKSGETADVGAAADNATSAAAATADDDDDSSDDGAVAVPPRVFRPPSLRAQKSLRLAAVREAAAEAAREAVAEARKADAERAAAAEAVAAAAAERELAAEAAKLAAQEAAAAEVAALKERLAAAEAKERRAAEAAKGEAEAAAERHRRQSAAAATRLANLEAQLDAQRRLAAAAEAREREASDAAAQAAADQAQRDTAAAAAAAAATAAAARARTATEDVVAFEGAVAAVDDAVIVVGGGNTGNNKLLDPLFDKNDGDEEGGEKGDGDGGGGGGGSGKRRKLPPLPGTGTGPAGRRVRAADVQQSADERVHALVRRARLCARKAAKDDPGTACGTLRAEAATKLLASVLSVREAIIDDNAAALDDDALGVLVGAMAEAAELCKLGLQKGAGGAVTLAAAVTALDDIAAAHPLVGDGALGVRCGAWRGAWSLSGTAIETLGAKVDACDSFLLGEGRPHGRKTSSAASVWEAVRLRLVAFPQFYLALATLWFAVLLAFASKMGGRPSAMQPSTLKLGVNVPGADKTNGGFGGGFGTTFLPLPPYYNFDASPAQSVIVPLVYGLMHTALLCVGLLPVCFWRVTWRAVVGGFPEIRAVVPVDDFEFLHRLLGFLALGAIFSGAFLWLTTMGLACAQNVDRACLAFALKDASPITNVLVLRMIVAPTWGLLLPLMAWAKVDWAAHEREWDTETTPAQKERGFWRLWAAWHARAWRSRFRWCARRAGSDECMIPESVDDAPPDLPYLKVLLATAVLPACVKRYWFEVCYWLHCGVAFATLGLALVARFDVFFPMLVSWGWYAVDKFLQRTRFYQHEMRLATGARKGHATAVSDVIVERAPESGPASVKLRVVLGPGAQRWEMFKGKAGAGQWIYLQVPAIGPVWHPFSLASTKDNDYIELLIDVRGGPALWRQSNEGDDDALGEDNRWVQRKGSETWTYQLYENIRRCQAIRARLRGETGGDRHRLLGGLGGIGGESSRDLHGEDLRAALARRERVRVRGPFGAAFTLCFDPAYSRGGNGAAVVYGSGIGLPSALSALRKFVSRKRSGGQAVPRFVWFVWSCRTVDELRLCWRALHDLLYDGFVGANNERGQALDRSLLWSPEVAMLGWLGITMYVTRADPDELAALKRWNPLLPDPAHPGRRHPQPHQPLELQALPAAEDRAFKERLHAWLAHPRRIVPARGDLCQLLRWIHARQGGRRLQSGMRRSKQAKIAVSFCGSSRVAQAVADDIDAVSAEIDVDVQFAADHQ